MCFRKHCAARRGEHSKFLEENYVCFIKYISYNFLLIFMQIRKLEKEKFPKAQLTLRTLTSAGRTIGFALDADAQEGEEINALLTVLKQLTKLDKEKFSVEVTGSSLSESFFQQTITALLIAFVIIPLSVPLFFKIGSEFMPALYEGTIFYMPITSPGISVTEAGRILAIQDRILKSFPEVHTVFGKAGRAETSTDPAPFSMMETTVHLKPRDQWGKLKKDYSSLPGWLRPAAEKILGSHRGITFEELIEEMDKKMQSLLNFKEIIKYDPLFL